MSVILTQSLYNGNEYFIFRPIGNDNYKEIKFKIENNKLIQNPKTPLNLFEVEYVERKLSCLV